MTDTMPAQYHAAAAARVKVLLVDDDQVILESLSSLLRGDGYAVDAVGPVEAQQVPMDQYRVAIAGIETLGVNGFELLGRLCGGDNRIVIVLAAYGMIESAVEAIKKGAHAYVTKPVVEDDVRLTLQKALLGRQMMDENRRLKEAFAMHGAWSSDTSARDAGAELAARGAWAAVTSGAATLGAAMAEPEKQIILTTLRANNGNRQSTACQLGINRTTLYKKMKKHGLLM